jgi:hypothetical protein
MQLNGWQRWGILLSILWVLGAGIHQRNEDIEQAESFAGFAHKVCSDGKAVEGNTDAASCELARNENRIVWMKNSWGNVAAMALTPIPFGWLLAFVLLHAGRAQVIGFRAVVPWRTLSKPKKAFVAFSGAAALAALLFGSMVVMNQYVDTVVPVSIGLKASVMKSGADYVVASGTWTRSGTTPGSAMGTPLQTSKIACSRAERRCTESRASVAGNTLMTDLIDYDVEKWDGASIVFKSEGTCVVERFTIDLVTETVNGAGRTANLEDPYCRVHARKDERWSYRLSDGFPVYWEERSKARPVPLKLIQTLFGH